MPKPFKNLKVYGLKNCDTVRKALNWLQANNIAYEWADYRAAPPSASELTNWLNQVDAKQLINTRSQTWRQLPEDVKQQPLSKDLARQLAQAHPSLMKRPILTFTHGEKTEIHLGFNEQDYQRMFTTAL